MTLSPTMTFRIVNISIMIFIKIAIMTFSTTTS